MPNCESCGYEAKNDHGLRIHSNKHKQPPVTETKPVDMPGNGTPSLTTPQEGKESELLKRINDLERENKENQKKLKMLYDVADKGRVFSWESKQPNSGQGQRVKLSLVEGKILVGWRTLRDELIHDPKTGRPVGEFQQYELLLYGEDGQHTNKVVDGYLNFSNLRYENRIECQVLGKTESYDGNVTFKVGLPDGERLI